MRRGRVRVKVRVRVRGRGREVGGMVRKEGEGVGFIFQRYEEG